MIILFTLHIVSWFLGASLTMYLKNDFQLSEIDYTSTFSYMSFIYLSIGLVSPIIGSKFSKQNSEAIDKQKLIKNLPLFGSIYLVFTFLLMQLIYWSYSG